MKTNIEVDGVKLTVEQVGESVKISKVVGRDRERKLDLTRGCEFQLGDSGDGTPAAIHLMQKLKDVAKYQTARCTCDYRYGFSDHAKHCTSIYVAKYDGGCYDDD